MSISLNKPGSDGLCIENIPLDGEDIENTSFWVDDHEECPGDTERNPPYYCFGIGHTIYIRDNTSSEFLQSQQKSIFENDRKSLEKKNVSDIKIFQKET